MLFARLHAGLDPDAKGQTIVEEAWKVARGRSEKVEQQHHRLMEQMQGQMQQDASAQVTSGGFNGMSMMHQYMGQDGSSFLLMSDNKREPVDVGRRKVSGWGADETVRHSMINVEITLNRWQDYYPGYMYVLRRTSTRFARRKPRTRRRAKKDFDPGAVSTGMQGDMIQPLVHSRQPGRLRQDHPAQPNGGRGGEPAHSCVQHGHERDRQTGDHDKSGVSCGARVRRSRWSGILYPGIQEGVRQFHSYSNDRELTVMGLFGAFVVEPRGSKYLDPLGTGPPTDSERVAGDHRERRPARTSAST